MTPEERENLAFELQMLIKLLELHNENEDKFKA